MEYMLECEDNNGSKKYFITEDRGNMLPIIIKDNDNIFKVKKYIKASKDLKKSKFAQKAYTGFFYDIRVLNINQWQEVEW